MNVLARIVEWANDLPLWQSDAVRRFLTQDALSPDEEIELCRMLKAAHGLDDPQNPAPQPQPVSTNCISSPDCKQDVTLLELHSLKNVNALAQGQSLKFAPDGITVVYGGNGAGKSGYARVLKRACHAREKKETILPNVHSQTARGKAEAVFELIVDGNHVQERWVNGNVNPTPLSQFAVFDSHCARVFVDEANEVVYIPYGLDVFVKLAALCKVCKERLQQEILAIGPAPKVFTEIVPDTEVGRFVSAMTHRTKVEALEKIVNLSETDLDRLAKLEKLHAESKINSPAVKAAALRRQKARIDGLKGLVLRIDAVLSKTKCDELRAFGQASRAADEAARLASAEMFKNEPLQGVGGDPWREMFEAAKRYSTVAAYPQRDFPVIDPDSVCVLCQQSLSDDAKNRLRRFQDFIEQDIARVSSEKRRVFERAVAEFKGLETTVQPPEGALLDEIRELSKEVADQIAAYFISARARWGAAIKACEIDSWDGIPTLSPSPADAIAAMCASLESSAKELDEVSLGEDQAKSDRELSELRARKLLTDNLDEVKSYLERLRLKHALEQCVKQTNTVGITKAGADISEQAITGKLEQSLTAELKLFGVQHIALRLKKTGDHGNTRHQLQLAVNHHGKVDLSGILSEGEQRIVAISSFLAELATFEGSCGIIFDDPVSSLDHLYREKVADRLVREARVRQVIVFTHDIVMLLAIKMAAARQQVTLLAQTVRRGADGPGVCDAEIPWQGMSVKERLSFVRARMPDGRKLHTSNDPAYSQWMSMTYGLLREAWERAIEEILLNECIQRFRPSIETKRLSKVLIESEDYIEIDRGMTKCSNWLTGHDAAAALGTATPDPAEIEGDIDALSNFVKSIKAKQEVAQRESKKRLEAPVPVLVGATDSHSAVAGQSANPGKPR